jgi:hypothetical protein
MMIIVEYDHFAWYLAGTGVISARYTGDTTEAGQSVMSKEVQELVNMGPLPDCETVAEEQLKMYESLLRRVTPPVSNDEARSLVRLFGPDDCYGLAWTLLHLIESAPGWPLHDCLKDTRNEGTERLRLRAERSSHV